MFSLTHAITESTQLKIEGVGGGCHTKLNKSRKHGDLYRFSVSIYLPLIEVMKNLVTIEEVSNLGIKLAWKAKSLLVLPRCTTGPRHLLRPCNRFFGPVIKPLKYCYMYILYLVSLGIPSLPQF